MKSIFTVLLILITTSCASQKDLDLLKWQIVELRKQQKAEKDYYNLEIEKLKKEFQDKLSTSSFSVRSSQADIVSKIESLRLKCARIQGDMDLFQKKVQENENNYTQLKERLDSLDKEFLNIKREVDRLKAFLGVTKKSVQLKKSKVSQAKTLKKQKDQSKKLRENEYELSPKKLYYQGLKNFKDKNYYAAVHLFSLFIEKFPKHSLIPNAYFWRGESYFRLGQYPRAILNYQVVLDKYKTSNKYPPALLKEGIAFYKLGKKKAGKILLEDLIQNFPHTNEARLAKKFLKNH
ncbi:tol-pal system protein YbgF [Desulfothermus sp.]